MSLFRAILQPDLPADLSAEARSRASTLVVAATLMVGVAAFYGIVNAVRGNLFIAAAMGAGLSGALLANVLVRRGAVDAAGHACIVTLYLCVTAAVISSGGAATPDLFWLLVVPMAAGLFRGVVEGLLWTACTLATAAGLVIVEQAGLWVLAETPPSGVGAFLWEFGGLLVVVAVITSSFLHGRSKAEAQAQQAIAALEAEVAERARHEAEARRLAEEALRAERRALEAGQVRSRFIATMSHEIRTPLNGILGITELLLDGSLDEDIHRDLVTVRNSGRTLLALLNDVLDLSKLDAGHLELEDIPFDPGAAVRDVARLYRPACARKGVELIVDIDEDACCGARGDPARFRQILLNLVSNASKFTAEGYVRIHLGRNDDTLRLAVEDTGIGIPEARRGRLFEPFSQVDASTTRKYGGTGLGLAITRQLVHAMGGAVEVHSRVGHGTTFALSLPLAACDLPSEEVSVGPARSRGRVLLVDDHPVNRMVACRMLERLGMQVVTAASGEEAIQAVQHGAFELVLMDVQMPGMDGLEATRRIRGLGASYRRLPIVALTANVSSEDRRASEQAGMDDHLGKPVDQRQLAEVCARWIRQRAA